MSFDAQTFDPTHFLWDYADGVATVTLNRPERKNPLTFDSYAELRDLFRALVDAPPVKAVVLAGAGGNFCSGGDVHEIIGPLPRIIGHGRAAELLFTGRSMSAEEGFAWGFWNRLSADCLADAQALASELANGPSYAHAVTKRQLDAEWHVSIEQALDMEAEAQADCMQTNDFKRAYEAFSAKQKPVFQGD